MPHALNNTSSPRTLLLAAILPAILPIATAGLAGCVSYWDIRKGEELVIGCAGELLWFPDADGDQWGDPDSTGKPGCTAFEDEGLTANNALDCDPSDPSITGQTGAICPNEIASSLGGSECVVGRQQGNSEFVSSCGESPLLPPLAARQECEEWSGWDTSLDPGAPALNRGLAALETDAEYNAVIEWLTAAAGGEPRAIWIDLRWSGSVQSGEWQWPDGTLPTYIPPCGGVEIEPGDFYPDLVPGLPESDETLEEHLPDLRAALVYNGNTWCRGIPNLSDDIDGPRSAHVLCERPRPILADYAEVPEEDGDATTPGPGQ